MKNVVVTATADATTQHLRKVNVLTSPVAGTSLPQWSEVAAQGNTFETVVSVSPAASGLKTVVIAAGGGGGATAEPSWWHAMSYGDRTATVTITTTAALGSGTIATLVDGAFSNGFWFSGEAGKEIKFDFATAKILNGFRWFQSTGATHGTWSVQGSADNSAWTTITTGITLGGANNTQATFTNTTAYRYYRLLSTAGSTSSAPWIYEIELRICAAADAARDAAEAGDRTAIITSSTTATPSSGTSVANLVDGLVGDSAADAFSFSNGESTKIVKWDFATGKTMIGLRWQSSSATGHGTWVVEGSNDDSAWTGVQGGFTLGSAAVQVLTWANSTAYRYYRLRQTSGTTSSTPWVEEAEFKLGA